MILPSEEFKLIYITEHPGEAVIAARAGVDRIMIDLEIEGKSERQGHLDTVISQHRPNSISKVAEELVEIGQGEVMVRVNPLSSRSESEVEEVISLGAQRLMFPMFKECGEVERFLELVANRIPVTLLLETQCAYNNLESILGLRTEYDIHIGLNDLHLDMRLDFMFQLLTCGVVDQIASACKNEGRTFGIGGVAPLSYEAKLSPRNILSYHKCVGSSAVILSRDWRALIDKPETFANEVSSLRSFIDQCRGYDRLQLAEEVDAVTELIKKRK